MHHSSAFARPRHHNSACALQHVLSIFLCRVLAPRSYPLNGDRQTNLGHSACSPGGVLSIMASTAEDVMMQYLLLAKGARGRALMELISRATSDPMLFAFGELLDVPTVSEVRFWTVCIWNEHWHGLAIGRRLTHLFLCNPDGQLGGPRAACRPSGAVCLRRMASIQRCARALAYVVHAARPVWWYARSSLHARAMARDPALSPSQGTRLPAWFQIYEQPHGYSRKCACPCVCLLLWHGPWALSMRMCTHVLAPRPGRASSKNSKGSATTTPTIQSTPPHITHLA